MHQVRLFLFRKLVTTNCPIIVSRVFHWDKLFRQKQNRHITISFIIYRLTTEPLYRLSLLQVYIKNPKTRNQATLPYIIVKDLASNQKTVTVQVIQGNAIVAIDFIVF